MARPEFEFYKSYQNSLCVNNQIITISDIKFLGIYIKDAINWKHHIEYILPKLSAACYAMRIIKPYVCLESLKIVY
jgi:hypothetical protein